MAPAWVLVDRYVRFVHDAAVSGGESKGGGELIGGASKVRGAAPSRQEMKEAIDAYLVATKPAPQVAAPPEISTLFMVRPAVSAPLCRNLTSGFIACADKNLLVLFAGPCHPNSYSAGYCLIYDAEKNSLSAIPQFPFDLSDVSVGAGTVVLRHGGGEGAYVLADLHPRFSSTPPEAALWMWWSSAATPGQWVKKVGRLPPEMCRTVFQANMSFSFGGSSLCWVDLLEGMLICDVLAAQEHEPEFRFIPLPEGCPTYTWDYQHQLRPGDFRSMGCVGGAIKFFTMDGHLEGRPANEVTLTTWTLTPDLREWKKDMEYHVSDLWTNETYLSMGLPQRIPMCPVLSMNEDDVVYLVSIDAQIVDNRVQYGGQYVLRVDMRHNKVLPFTKYHPGSEKRLTAQLFASEFSAYLQGPKDNQRGVEAREVGASGKRMKL